MAELILGSDKKLFSKMMNHWKDEVPNNEKPKESRRLKKKRRASASFKITGTDENSGLF